MITASLPQKIIQIVNLIKDYRRNGLLKEYSTINSYLQQGILLYEKKLFNLDLVEVVTMSKIPNRKFSVEDFINEMNNAPTEIVGIVNDLNVVLQKLYECKHPYKYKLMQYKKNVYIRILSIILDMVRKKSLTISKDIAQELNNHTPKGPVYKIKVGSDVVAA